MRRSAHIARQREIPLMVDLCCGLGGASAPARARGWQVVGLDIERGVKPDVVADLRALPLPPDLRPYLLWVSWPCIEYARWALPWKPKVTPSAELMQAAVAARDYLKPLSWVFENTANSVRWCAPTLGPPPLKTWGHVFWSNLFPLLPQVLPHKTNAAPPGFLRPYIRSLIPVGVAQAFVIAAERRAAQIGWREVPL